jgi:hypothetical protein
VLQVFAVPQREDLEWVSESSWVECVGALVYR